MVAESIRGKTLITIHDGRFAIEARRPRGERKQILWNDVTIILKNDLWDLCIFLLRMADSSWLLPSMVSAKFQL